jgi:glycerol kinase
MQPGLLSLDVGTTLTKAVLFDLAGRELAVAEYGFTLHTPLPGWVELDPVILWAANI